MTGLGGSGWQEALDRKCLRHQDALKKDGCVNIS